MGEGLSPAASGDATPGDWTDRADTGNPPPGALRRQGVRAGDGLGWTRGVSGRSRSCSARFWASRRSVWRFCCGGFTATRRDLLQFRRILAATVSPRFAAIRRISTADLPRSCRGFVRGVDRPREGEAVECADQQRGEDVECADQQREGGDDDRADQQREGGRECADRQHEGEGDERAIQQRIEKEETIAPTDDGAAAGSMSDRGPDEGRSTDDEPRTFARGHGPAWWPESAEEFTRCFRLDDWRT